MPKDLLLFPLFGGGYFFNQVRAISNLNIKNKNHLHIFRNFRLSVYQQFNPKFPY